MKKLFSDKTFNATAVLLSALFIFLDCDIFRGILESTVLDTAERLAEDASDGQMWMNNILMIHFLIFAGLLIVFISIGVISLFRYFKIISFDEKNTYQGERVIKDIESRDSLTGLINRNMFEFIAGKELELSPEVNHAFFYIDIDDFASYNSEYGSDAGDRLLSDFAALLKSVFRDRDVIARIEKDEFAVMVNDYHTHNNLKSLAERLSSSVAEKFVYGGNALNVSIGISEYYDEELSELIIKAEEALERAKLDKKSRYKFA